MLPCTPSNCSSDTASPSPNSALSSPYLSAEAIVAISFGIVMFILALLTLLQGRRRRRRRAYGHREDSPSPWPRSHATINWRRAADELPYTRPVGNENTYFNVCTRGLLAPIRTPAAPSSAPAAVLSDEPQPKLPTLPSPNPVHNRGSNDQLTGRAIPEVSYMTADVSAGTPTREHNLPNQCLDRGQSASGSPNKQDGGSLEEVVPMQLNARSC
ncbi:MAG: hypothetical protein Q9173_005824 [Seirophora scorigena]